MAGMTRPRRHPTAPRSLAATLEALRIKAGLDREELAAAAGLNPMTISRIELGTTPDPKWSTLLVIAKALDLDLEWLAANTDPPAGVTEPAA